MTTRRTTWAWAIAALAGVAWAAQAGAVDPLSLKGGLSIGAALGCLTCGGLGLTALMSGASVTAFLFSRAAFLASTACIGLCVTAVTT